MAECTRAETGRRTFHRVGKPGLQRKLGAFAHAARKNPQPRRHQQHVRDLRVVAGRVVQANGFFGRVDVEPALRIAKHLEQPRPRLAVDIVLREMERAEPGPENHQPDQKAEVAHAVHDERLVGGRAGRAAFHVEADQQVTANADQLPEDEDLEDIAGEHQSEHRETEERHVGEELVIPPRPVEMSAAGRVDLVVDVVLRQFVAHVAQREDVDARGDQRDHHEHHERQAVDVVVQRDDEVAKRRQGVETAREPGSHFPRRSPVRRRRGGSDVLLVGNLGQRGGRRMRLGLLDVRHGPPTRGAAPHAEGRNARAEAEEDARHGQIRGRLAASR